MIRKLFFFLCISYCPVTTNFGDQGLASNGKVIQDITPLVSGAAALVIVYSPVQPSEIEGFEEVLTIIDEGCRPPVRRHDGNSTLPPAVILICIEDESDVMNHMQIDANLENVIVVAPQDHMRFLDKLDLEYDSRMIEVFTEVHNGKLQLKAGRKTSMPFPRRNDPKRARMLEKWKLEFRDLAGS